MKKKMTKKTKKAICIYVIALLLLYVVVEVLPEVTNIFETTQVLKPGNLTLSYETVGYFIKEECVCTAADSGNIHYEISKNTVIKKGNTVVSVDAEKTDKSKEKRFSEYMDRLKGYDGVSDNYNAPISGVFSLEIDGYEDYFTRSNMNKIKREKVESLSYNTVDLERASVIKGEPIYKISSDDNWYILCWVDEKTAKGYDEGKSVTLELPDGPVDAKVHSVKKEDQGCRVIFYLDVYYESFASSRAEDMTIVVSDNAGLIVNNKCIIEKDGAKGVYVKNNKTGEFVFKKISIIATDGKDSVIEDAAFIDEEGNRIYTVDVYDEVLKNPEKALKKDIDNVKQ